MDAQGGSAMRTARVAAGLSAEELGLALGITAQAVRAMERGSPCPGRAFQIARLLQVDPKAFTYQHQTNSATKRGKSTIQAAGRRGTSKSKPGR